MTVLKAVVLSLCILLHQTYQTLQSYCVFYRMLYNTNTPNEGNEPDAVSPARCYRWR